MRAITIFNYAVTAFLAIVVVYLIYDGITYNKEISNAIESEYEIYINGQLVEPDTVDLKNYNSSNVTIDNDLQRVLIAVS